MGNDTSKEMKEIHTEMREQEKRVTKSEMRLNYVEKANEEKGAKLNELRQDERESKKRIEELQIKLGEYGAQMQTLNLKIEEHKAETRRNMEICKAKVEECRVKTDAEVVKSNARAKEFEAMADCFKQAMLLRLNDITESSDVDEQQQENLLSFAGIQAQESLERIQLELQSYDEFSPDCRY